jgi:hypothetical protein
MLNPKTHFEQVPVELVKRIAEEEIKQQEKAEQARTSRTSQRKRDAMADEELRFPEWQGPLQEFILEFDREKALERAQKVEKLLLERLQQLRQGSDGHSELMALNDALSLFRMIKRDKLGAPDGK